MPSCNILKEVTIEPSFRVSQMAGIFDLPLMKKSRLELAVNIPIEADNWSIGLIVGPSGCGKSTIARELFGNDLITFFDWPTDKSILDSFPEKMGVKDIVQLLNSVGFSSPPSWVRPYNCLSNGEQFRVTLARALSLEKPLVVFDEFTSVVDRDVARIASACVAKTIRKNKNKRFIAISCHYDIIDWLDPDWIFMPHTNEFKRRRLRRRPPINLCIIRAHRSAWRLFAKHHYLSKEINTASKCFVAFWEEKPAAFISIIFFPHPKLKRVWRIHRHVCLPDYQGVGIGMVLEETIASMLKSLKFRCHSPTSHPAKIHYLNQSSNWKIIRKPSIKGNSKMRLWKPDMLRLQATFEYVGPPHPNENLAKKMLNSS